MTIKGEQLRVAYKNPCRLATTANVVDLAAGAPNTVDGVAVAQFDRIMVRAQSSGQFNGIYVVDTVGTGSDGSWSRALDFNETNNDRITAGLEVYIQLGSTLGGKVYRLTTTGAIVLDTTVLTFTDLTAGAGIGGSTGSLDNALLRADGTGGSTVQASPSATTSIFVDDTGNLYIPEGMLLGWHNSGTPGPAFISVDLTGTTDMVIQAETIKLQANEGAGTPADFAVQMTALGNFEPLSNTTRLGHANFGWEDLYLASNAVITFVGTTSQDMTITNNDTNDRLEFAGADYYQFAGTGGSPAIRPATQNGIGIGDGANGANVREVEVGNLGLQYWFNSVQMWTITRQSTSPSHMIFERKSGNNQAGHFIFQLEGTNVGGQIRGGANKEIQLGNASQNFQGLFLGLDSAGIDWDNTASIIVGNTAKKEMKFDGPHADGPVLIPINDIDGRFGDPAGNSWHLSSIQKRFFPELAYASAPGGAAGYGVLWVEAIAQTALWYYGDNDVNTALAIQGRGNASGTTTTTAWVYTIPESTTVTLDILVAANTSDDSDKAGYKFTATVYRIGAGTATLGSSQKDYEFETDASMDCVVDVTGNTVRVRGTGNSGGAQTRWKVTVRMVLESITGNL